MREGKNIIEQMSKNMDPDNIGELMDEITETFQTSKEVTDAISRPIGELYDEDDLLKELEDESNVDSELEKSLQNIAHINVPVKNIPLKITKKTDEEELNELMLSMT
jgi:charged multivesicular body protein 4